MNAVEYLNTPLSTDGKLYSIGASAWKNCRVGQWDLSYECISSARGLTEWCKMPADFRAKIESSQPLFTATTSPSTMLAEDVEGDSEGDDDEDVPLSLSCAQVV